MIHCIMPLFVDVVINFKFVNFNQKIMCTYSEQHRQCWTWLLNTLFYGCKRCCLIVLLLEGQDGQTWNDRVHNCTLCHLRNVDGQIDPSLVIDPIKWLYLLCGQSIKVAIMLNLWSMFKRLAYGMSYVAIGKNISQKMVLFIMHKINPTTYSCN